ncbi:MAG: hypothetical protein ABL921_32225 [Pirellula sp.]
MRTESMRLDGKIRCKAYLVNSYYANGQFINVEHDLTKTDAASRAVSNTFGPLVEHFEIDPYGLSLSHHTCITGTMSSMDNVIRFWVTMECV